MYRKNFIWSMLLRIGWFFLFILFYRILYNHIHALKGFGYYEALCYFAVFNMFENIYSLLFQQNISSFINDVRTGAYDFVITKPVNTLFLTTFRYIQISAVFNVLPALILLIYAMNHLEISSIFMVIQFFYYLCFAFIIFYSLVICCLTLGFWFYGFSAMNAFFSGMFDMVMYPPTIYKGFLYVFLNFIVPFGLITYEPVRVLLSNHLDLSQLLIYATFSGTILYLANKFFSFGLKHYASASS